MAEKSHLEDINNRLKTLQFESPVANDNDVRRKKSNCYLKDEYCEFNILSQIFWSTMKKFRIFEKK